MSHPALRQLCQGTHAHPQPTPVTASWSICSFPSDTGLREAMAIAKSQTGGNPSSLGKQLQACERKGLR